MFECEADKDRYLVGTDGGHLMVPFMCDICVFHLLFRREVTYTEGDYDHLVTIRRMNLDALWGREPSTITANMRSVAKLVGTCETLGIKPNLPKLGPFPYEDRFGFAVAFSMLTHSLQGGRHDKTYTQFATIRKQRATFSNLYHASVDMFDAKVMLNPGTQSNGILASCHTQSQWFTRWCMGCETRMGFVLKQDKAVTIQLLMKLIDGFIAEALENRNDKIIKWKAVVGLAYLVISFHASLRGSEGLKVYYPTLEKYWNKGNYSHDDFKAKNENPPHIIIPIKGRFKGEQGERCHLLPLSNSSKSGVNIRKSIHALIKLRNECKIESPWLFTDHCGSKLSFDEMNEIFLDKLEEIKERDHANILGLEDQNIREDYSINRSLRRGSSTRAQLLEIPTDIIEVCNRWKKIERSKGRKAKLSMIETYADIELLIPKMVKYSALL